MFLTKVHMSNGKIEVVYAKQALLKPAKNFRCLWQKAKAVVRPAARAAALGGHRGSSSPSPLRPLVTGPKAPDLCQSKYSRNGPLCNAVWMIFPLFNTCNRGYFLKLNCSIRRRFRDRPYDCARRSEEGQAFAGMWRVTSKWEEAESINFFPGP